MDTISKLIQSYMHYDGYDRIRERMLSEAIYREKGTRISQTIKWVAKQIFKNNSKGFLFIPYRLRDLRTRYNLSIDDITKILCNVELYHDIERAENDGTTESNDKFLFLLETLSCIYDCSPLYLICENATKLMYMIYDYNEVMMYKRDKDPEPALTTQDLIYGLRDMQMKVTNVKIWHSLRQAVIRDLEDSNIYFQCSDHGLLSEDLYYRYLKRYDLPEDSDDPITTPMGYVKDRIIMLRERCGLGIDDAVEIINKNLKTIDPDQKGISADMLAKFEEGEEIEFGINEFSNLTCAIALLYRCDPYYMISEGYEDISILGEEEYEGTPPDRDDGFYPGYDDDYYDYYKEIFEYK